MNILIAPNAFKNALTAQDAAQAIADGFKQSGLDCICKLFPVGDGGDGTGKLITEHLKGITVSAQVRDALGRQINTTFGLIDDDRTAVIEMAEASGIRLLKADELNPMQTNSYGTGELIKQALDKGVTKVIIGMGGSATVDCGAGMLSALGLKFLNAVNKELKPIPAELIDLAKIDASNLDKRVLNCEIIILCDVNNKLLGDEGAAAVFGPQKGATPVDIIQLDAMLTKFATIAQQQTGIDITTIKHGGTAGGAAAGLYSFLNAKLVEGAYQFLTLTGFDAALQDADVIITGEGSIDEQTLHGKAPAAVASLAKQKGLPVIGLAGSVPLKNYDALNQYFNVLISINNFPTDLPSALKNTRDNLVRTSCQIGRLLTFR